MTSPSGCLAFLVKISHGEQKTEREQMNLFFLNFEQCIVKCIAQFFLFKKRLCRAFTLGQPFASKSQRKNITKKNFYEKDQNVVSDSIIWLVGLSFFAISSEFCYFCEKRLQIHSIFFIYYYLIGVKVRNFGPDHLCLELTF